MDNFKLSRIASKFDRGYWQMFQYGYNDNQSKINSFLVKKLYPKADLIISNAKASAEDLIANLWEGYSWSKIINL